MTPDYSLRDVARDRRRRITFFAVVAVLNVAILVARGELVGALWTAAMIGVGAALVFGTSGDHERGAQ